MMTGQKHYSRGASIFAVSTLLLLICITVFSSCEQGDGKIRKFPADTVKIYQTDTVYNSGFSSNSLGTNEPRSPISCSDVFPDEKIMNYDFTIESEPGELPLHYKISYTCHYELSFFDECCRCEAKLNYLEIPAGIADGTEVRISIPGASQGGYTGQSVILQGGVLDLEASDLDVEVKNGLDIYLDVPGGNASQIISILGGLAIVVDIEGGGN